MVDETQGGRLQDSLTPAVTPEQVMMSVPFHEPNSIGTQPPGRVFNCLMFGTHRRSECDLDLFSQELLGIPNRFAVLDFQFVADWPPTTPQIEDHFLSRTKGCIHNTNDSLPTDATSRISQLQRDVWIWEQLLVTLTEV